MKKLLTYTLASLLMIVSCKKGDTNLPKSVQVPAPLITVNATGDATINVQSSATADAFNGKFNVDLYFKNGAKPAKFDIVIVKNTDFSVVKTIAAGVTTFPTALSITGIQLRTLFNAAIVLGDSFTIGANITTTDGRYYPAFSTVAQPYSSGILSAPGFSPSITFSAVCQFNITDYGAIDSTTPFTVVRDDAGFFTPGQTIPVTIIDATHFSFEFPANNPKPVVIAVNALTNATTVAKQIIGDLGDGNGNYSVNSVGGDPANFVFPCNLTVGVTLDITAAGLDFGNYTIILKTP